MKIYSIEEKDYSDLEESLECIVAKAKKLLKKMENGDFGSRNRYDDDDDYDWKIKKGSRY